MNGELAHTRVTVDGIAAQRWMLFLHGILGSGGNWRTMARRVIEGRAARGDATWGAILVDLRLHGRSQGFLPPHTVASAARDLDALSAAYSEPIDAVVGHSFGGKVALEYVTERSGDLAEAWILDSTPSARPDARGSETTLAVVTVLESLPPTFASRGAFDDALKTGGLDGDERAGLRQWLATNLERSGDLYRLRLALADVRTLLEDYFVVDAWNVLAYPPGRVAIHMVIADRSNVLNEADRARAELEATSHPTRVFCHHIANAGHWLHVDAPDALAELLTSGMSRMSR